MRSGNWKYIKEGQHESLHDLSIDEREQSEFGESNPDILDRLRKQYAAWESTVLKYPPRTRPQP
jgi:hypothetical protein